MEEKKEVVKEEAPKKKVYETVRQEAKRLGISISKVRKKRQGWKVEIPDKKGS